MKIVRVRPKKKGKRLKAKAALYTVAYGDVNELRRHDSSFSSYCKDFCPLGIKRGCKYSCNEDGEYGRLLHLWSQQGYLLAFFSNQKDRLKTDRYGHITVSQAIRRHGVLLNKIRSVLETGDLNSIFDPLYQNPSKEVIWPEKKFKFKYRTEEYENWIRIYAVRFVEEDTGIVNYIITGGGIKLVGKMSDFAPLEYEERKQEMVINFLIENGLTTRERIEAVVL